MTAQEIVLDELGCYYLGDEISPTGPGFVANEVPRRAAESVERMARKAGVDGRAPLLDLLGALRVDRQHPLHERITAETLISWIDDDESWASFQALLDAIISGLQSA